MLDEYSVKVTASLGVGLGVPAGERGACDVPFVLFTEIAMPSFVPAEQNEFAIRFAVDSLQPVLNTRISSILEVSARQDSSSNAATYSRPEQGKLADTSLTSQNDARKTYVLQVKELQCLIPECGDPAFAITITPMEAYEMVRCKWHSLEANIA